MPQGEGAPTRVAEQTGEPSCHTALKVWLFSEWQLDALLQASSSCSSSPSWQRSWPHWTQSSGCTLASRLLGGCTVPGLIAVSAHTKHILQSPLEASLLDWFETNLVARPPRGVLALLPFLSQKLPVLWPPCNVPPVCFVHFRLLHSHPYFSNKCICTPERPSEHT